MNKLTHYEISDGISIIPEIICCMKSLKSLTIPRSVDLNKRIISEVFNKLECLKLCYTNKLLAPLEFKNLQILNISSKYDRLLFDAQKMPNIIKLIAENVTIVGISTKLNHLEMTNSIVMTSKGILNELKTYIEIGNSEYKYINENEDVFTYKDSINIEILQLSKKISSPLLNFENLRFLVISSPDQREIPSFIFELPAIDSIAFENCEINILFDNINKPSVVKHIIVRNSFVHDIHPNIIFLDSLESLNLSKNLIFSASLNIFKLPYLENLDLSNNYIETLPIEIILATNLKLLNIKNNRIIKLPYQIHDFTTKIDFISDDIKPNPMFELYKDKIISLKGSSGSDPFGYESVEYPNFVIDKICELLEHLEPFEMPDYNNDTIYTDITKKKLNNFIINDNMILLGKINFMMVFIAFNNLMNKSGEVFLQKTKNRMNASKINDPYMLILAVIK